MTLQKFIALMARGAIVLSVVVPTTGTAVPQDDTSLAQIPSDTSLIYSTSGDISGTDNDATTDSGSASGTGMGDYDYPMDVSVSDPYMTTNTYPPVQALTDFTPYISSDTPTLTAVPTTSTSPPPTSVILPSSATSSAISTDAAGATTPDPNGEACSTLLNAYAACASATPNFGASAFADQASCFCYSGNNWDGPGFDERYVSCLDYVATADPDAYYDDVLYTDGLGEAISTPCEYASMLKAEQTGGSAVDRTMAEQSQKTLKPPTVTKTVAAGATRSGTVSRSASRSRGGSASFVLKTRVADTGLAMAFIVALAMGALGMAVLL